MGAGTVDGQGGHFIDGTQESWWQLARRAQRENSQHNVPRLLEVNQSESFTLYRITLRNSPGFHVTLHGVDGFTAWGVKIDSPTDARNTDGIDPISSRNITVTHSFIRTGDDSIAIKAGAAGPSRQISIVDNHFYGGHGMSIGSETVGGVSQVLVNRLSMEGSVAGLRIKSDRSRGGLVEDVSYSDVCLRAVKAPIEITMRYAKGATGDAIPRFENIRFDKVRSVTAGELVILGEPLARPIHAVFKEVEIAGPRALRVQGADIPVGVVFAGAEAADRMNCNDRFAPFPVDARRQYRPELSAVDAKRYAPEEVLGYAGIPGREERKPWLPEPDPIGPADYLVDQALAGDQRNSFRTVQAAVNQAVRDARASQSTQRIHIAVKPGRYQGLVYVPPLDAPITLYGLGTKPGDTVLTASLDASVSGKTYAEMHGSQFLGADAAIRSMFEGVSARQVLTTFGSATLWTRNVGFHARNLTIENAYARELPNCVDDCRAPTVQVMHQAVALMVDGADRSQFESVRLLGLQDTLYLKAQEGGLTSRSYFSDSYIEGDVDFIFGDATAFFHQTEIKSLGRQNGTYVAAPSTHLSAPYGFVFDRCRFTHDDSVYALKGSNRFARQWFHNQRCTPFGTLAIGGYRCDLAETDAYAEPTGTISAQTLDHVGKMVVMNSFIGSHISETNPWADWNQSGKMSFRPVQLSVADFLENIHSVFPDAVLETFGTLPQPGLRQFLAEYRNQAEKH